MTTKKRNSLSTSFFIILFFILSFIDLNAVVWHNRVGTGYGSSDGERAVVQSELESYIIQGAAYYIRAAGSYQAYLEQVEDRDNQGMDLQTLSSIIAKVSQNLQAATGQYKLLTDRAAKTPYNPDILEKLSVLDFQALGQQKQMNPVILASVKQFLEKGDITGLLKKTAHDLDRLLEAVELLETDIAAGNIPTLENTWKINETFAEMTLFGSYTARVFAAVN